MLRLASQNLSVLLAVCVSLLWVGAGTPSCQQRNPDSGDRALLANDTANPEENLVRFLKEPDAPDVDVHAALPQVDERREKTGPFGDVLGLGVKFSQGQPMSDLEMLTDLGVRWVRDGVFWKALEPRPGVYRPFPEAFRTRLEFYLKHDIGVVFLLAYGNDAAYPPTDKEPHRNLDPVAFSGYALHVARELEKYGVRFVLNIWNEPHNFQIRPALGGAWNGRPPSPWVDHYLRLVHETVNRVKEFNGDIKLLTDEDMWVLHYWFLEGGLPSQIDGFGVHPYVRKVPEIAAVSQDTNWMKPFVAVDENRAFGSAVRRLRNRGAEKLGKPPEIWITEWGWPVGKSNNPLDEETVASYLPRAFVLAAAAGVETMCWFSSWDAADGPMGLLDKEGKKRKAYFAYKTMSERLASLRYRGQLEGAEHPTRGVQAFRFASDDEEDGQTIVVWNMDKVERRLTMSGPLASATVYGSLGQLVMRTAANQVILGPDPMYFVGARSTGSLSRLLNHF